MDKRSSLGLCCTAVFLSFAASLLGPGCYSAVPNDGLVDASFTCTSSTDVAPGTIGPGVPCSAEAGTLPAGNCHVPWATTSGHEDCSTSAKSSCAIGSVSNCGDPKTCMPMTINAPPTYNFRMEAVHVIWPIVLTNTLLQNEALTAGVTPNVPSCSNEQESLGVAAPHAGGFNWLLSLDTSKHTIKTGGALPVPNPYATGYCFLNKTFENIQVAPVNLDAVIADSAASGAIAFSSKPGSDVLNIPIFVTAADPTAPIILPIRGAEFHDVTISPDGNCIGDINQAWYCNGTASCTDNHLDSCPKWYTGGALAGYMTLADADKVTLEIMGGDSLCTLLVGEEMTKTCTKEDFTKGDYCSTSKKAGDCADSIWLAIAFAANAVSIGSSACGN